MSVSSADSGRAGIPRSPKWTAAEDALLREHYPACGSLGVRVHLPGRSPHAIRNRALQLGLERAPPDSAILARELIRDALRAHKGRIAATARSLGVPATSLKRRAQQLRLIETSSNPHWSGSELAKLRAQLAAGNRPKAADFPGRSAEAVRKQARHLRAASAKPR